MGNRLGLYIAVPFCRAKCSFCNFASDAFAPGRMPAYLAALQREISGIRARASHMGATLPFEADSLYFGGGTPSLLQPQEIQAIFASVRQEFHILPGAEITIECAPGQLSGQSLEEFQRQGVSRISLGVQSFIDAEATAVGRSHTAAACHHEITRLRQAGVQSVGADLIAGLPLQTLESWETSLSELQASGVDHASIYMLEIDDESRLGREVARNGHRYGAGALPSEDDTAAMYERACARLPEWGLAQYEISNFARPGKQSQHNLKYWRREPYVGLGLDAHSMLQVESGTGEIRFANDSDLGAYIAAESSLPILGSAKHADEDLAPRKVDSRAALEEALFLGLRMTEGISIASLPASATERAAVTLLLHEAQQDGLVIVEGDVARLSLRGRLLSNEVFARLLEPA